MSVSATVPHSCDDEAYTEVGLILTGLRLPWWLLTLAVRQLSCLLGRVLGRYTPVQKYRAVTFSLQAKYSNSGFFSMKSHGDGLSISAQKYGSRRLSATEEHSLTPGWDILFYYWWNFMTLT